MAISKKSLIGKNASSKNKPTKMRKADIAGPAASPKLKTATSTGGGTIAIGPVH